MAFLHQFQAAGNHLQGAQIMPRRLPGGGGKLHAPDLALAGNDDHLEISIAAFIAQSNAQYSYVAILVFDFVPNSAERLIFIRGPIRRAIPLRGGLACSHGHCGDSRKAQFLYQSFHRLHSRSHVKNARRA
jgi:hypothetical protein